MRADRLVAVLLTLQSRGRVTAAQLAEELEVSVATARRDLEALSAAGIPVYPQAGRGGGWQLLGGARTDLSGLSSNEARALFLLVGPAASVAPEAKAALRKLVRALPETFRTDAEAAAEAVVIDPGEWGRPARERPALLPLLEAAIVDRVRLRIRYAAWNREPAERTVDPWGLVQKQEHWYLLGGVDGAERTYRIDRMLDAERTGEPAERPDDLDLAEVWERVTAAVDRQRTAATATIIVDSGIVPLLHTQFGQRAVAETPLDPGRSRVTVTAPTDVIIARGLAGWAEYLEVVEPESLRQELHRLGAALVARNAIVDDAASARDQASTPDSAPAPPT
ncbi:putative DNA-binding transcriptional regulator YafY [Agromyces hippuratus]|uniref:Putative DNA-binding transcriptional regulator YafY n=1 Tax=Agromyces hippuratus TaxID=286438 RepID=A0A852X2K5_9MICO|nr:YafY family protein [Agromyces hippuratus]NYG21674.1 putative DNA-binding transcriptional regulator YafY [Agromyces hippuratus]